MIDIEVEEDGSQLIIIQCDSCDDKLPPRRGHVFALLLAAEAKWATRTPVRKFGGTAFYDFCPICRKESK